MLCCFCEEEVLASACKVEIVVEYLRFSCNVYDDFFVGLHKRYVALNTVTYMMHMHLMHATPRMTQRLHLEKSFLKVMSL